MADLPNSRFADAENQYPFLTVGLDFSDPIISNTEIRNWESNMSVFSPVLSPELCIWKLFSHWTHVDAY